MWGTCNFQFLKCQAHFVQLLRSHSRQTRDESLVPSPSWHQRHFGRLWGRVIVHQKIPGHYGMPHNRSLQRGSGEKGQAIKSAGWAPLLREISQTHREHLISHIDHQQYTRYHEILASLPKWEGQDRSKLFTYGRCFSDKAFNFHIPSNEKKLHNLVQDYFSSWLFLRHVLLAQSIPSPQTWEQHFLSLQKKNIWGERNSFFSDVPFSKEKPPANNEFLSNAAKSWMWIASSKTLETVIVVQIAGFLKAMD